MSKFISFTKLVDSGNLLINMDDVKTMEPVRKLYNSHMTDCTDIYYENHRVTVIAGILDIMETLSGMNDGDAENMALGYNELDPNSETYQNPVEAELNIGDTSLLNISLYMCSQSRAAEDPSAYGWQYDKDHHMVLFIPNLADKPIYWADAETFTDFNIPEGQNYIYVVYITEYVDGAFARWCVKKIFLNYNDALAYSAAGTEPAINDWQGNITFSEPVKVPLYTQFDMLADNYDESDVPMTEIFISYGTKKSGKIYKTNEVFMGISGVSSNTAHNILSLSTDNLVNDTIYDRTFILEDALANGNNQIYIAYKVFYKNQGGNKKFKNHYVHNAFPLKVFLFESKCSDYIDNLKQGLNPDNVGYDYRSFQPTLEHKYKIHTPDSLGVKVDFVN